MPRKSKTINSSLNTQIKNGLAAVQTVLTVTTASVAAAAIATAANQLLSPINKAAKKARTKNYKKNNKLNNSSGGGITLPSEVGYGRRRKRRQEKDLCQTMKVLECAESKPDDLQQLVTEALKTCQSGKELQALCFTLQPDPQKLQEAFKHIEHDLLELFYYRFPETNIRIYCFGSTLNGLAFKDSDFDLYVKMDGNNLPENRIVYVMGGQLQLSTQFTKIVCIGRAKVPILKCYHQATGFYCDISFSTCTNGLGVYNTNACRYFFSLDFRLHPLAIILKYWLRTHKLSGSGRITNYCLMLLIIFYVQTLEQPILPSVHYFQTDCTPMYVDYWNVAIDISKFNRQSQMPNQHCSMKVSDLVLGFFEFYRYFDFEKNIICPLYGRSYDRQLFANVATVPTEFSQYIDAIKSDSKLKLNIARKMCIQDPFNLCYNVASSCSVLLFKRFQNELSYAAKICREILDKNGESSELLLKLFNESSPIIETVPLQEVRRDLQINSTNFYCKLEPLEFELSIVRMVLSKSTDSQQTFEKCDVYHQWSLKVVDFVVLIFKRLFLFDVTIVNVENNTPDADTKIKNNTKAEPNLHTNKIHRQLIITGKFCVYQHNRRALPKLTSAATYLKINEEQSLQAYAKKEHPINLDCVIDIFITQQFKSMEFIFHTRTESKKQLKNVFYTFVQKIRLDLRAHFLNYGDNCLAINAGQSEQQQTKETKKKPPTNNSSK